MRRTAQLLFVSMFLAACGPRSVSLESGSYTLVQDVNEGTMEAVPTVTFKLDLEGGKLELSDNGSSSSINLERVDESEWVEQCPTMRNSQLLEWARLDGPLTIADTTYDSPVIMSSCDAKSFWFIGDKQIDTKWVVQIGEEQALVDQMPDETLPEPLSFVPSDML